MTSGNWFGICNDTGQQVDVTDRAVVTFVQGSLRRELGRTNSDASGSFSITVVVPVRAQTGTALLEVRGRAASDDVPLAINADALPRTGSGPLLAVLGVVALGSAVGLRRLERPRS